MRTQPPLAAACFYRVLEHCFIHLLQGLSHMSAVSQAARLSPDPSAPWFGFGWLLTGLIGVYHMLYRQNTTAST